MTEKTLGDSWVCIAFCCNKQIPTVYDVVDTEGFNRLTKQWECDLKMCFDPIDPNHDSFQPYGFKTRQVGDVSNEDEFSNLLDLEVKFAKYGVSGETYEKYFNEFICCQPTVYFIQKGKYSIKEIFDIVSQDNI